MPNPLSPLPAALLAACLAGACAAPLVSASPALSVSRQVDEGKVQPARPRTERPRTWFEVATAVVDSDPLGGYELDSSSAFFLNGGYDFLTGPQHGGLEMGVSWNRVDVIDPLSLGLEPYLDTTTWYLGGRLATDFGDWPVGCYVRAGGLYSDRSDHGISGLDANGTGYYWGAGLDWWYYRGAALSLFVLRTDGDDIGSTAVGLSARFFIVPDESETNPAFPDSGPAWR